jgi:uncharacterized protein (DUF2252 family)
MAIEWNAIGVEWKKIKVRIAGESEKIEQNKKGIILARTNCQVKKVDHFRSFAIANRLDED